MLTVVKVGGGLARELGDAALGRLCRKLGELAAEHPLLIVPGGGAFADVVRDHDRRFGLSARSSHRMALLAMDQFGLVLSELIPGAQGCLEPAEASARAAGGRATVLLGAVSAAGDDLLPASWDVSSDSVAVWAAGVAGARRVVLIKAVDGLYLDWPARADPSAQLTADELERLHRHGRCTGVDRYLPTALRTAGVEAWVIGGAEPARLGELLERGSTRGTRLIA